MVGYGANQDLLVYPQNEEVEVYRSSQSMELIKLPASLSGEDILSGFVLELPIF